MTILSHLAEYVVHGAFSNSDRKHMSIHIADTAAALICGRFVPEGKELMTRLYKQNNLVLEQSLYSNEVLDNVLLQCALTRLTEIDDIHLSSCVTPGSVIIPAALSFVAAHRNLSVQSFTDSIIIGYELIIRLGKTIRGAEIVYNGIWPTYFCAAFGTAATTARLLRLTEEETMHALSLALTLSTGGVSRGLKLPFRWFTLGCAARAGCMAAIVAANGFTGDPAMLDGDWFEQTYGIKADTTHLTENIGQSKMVDEISLKPYCSAKQVVSSVYGFQQIMAQGISLKGLREIKLFVPPQMVSMIDHGASNRLSSISSAPYQLALAAYHPDGLYDVARTEIVATQEISSFMDKVHIFGDPELSEHYPEKWPSKIEIITQRGIFNKLITDSPGDPGIKLSKEALTGKIRRFLHPILGEAPTQEFIELCMNAASDKTSLLKLADWVQP